MFPLVHFSLCVDMSVLWVSRGLTGGIIVVVYLLSQYEIVWTCLEWIWRKGKRILLAILLGIIFNLAMSKVFEARPDFYQYVETKIDSIIGAIWQGICAIFYFLIDMFGNKAIDYFLYGFNATNKQITV